jgi:hypothetical protein
MAPAEPADAKASLVAGRMRPNEVENVGLSNVMLV